MFHFYLFISYKFFKVCVRYFSLFLKDKVFLCFFEWITLKRNLTYSCFFFPLFHKHLFSPGLPRATRLLETSCLEKITVCVIETMLVTLPLVQMNKAQREVNQTNQVQTKINLMKGLQMFVIHWIPGSTWHWISNQMKYLLKKKSFGWNIFQQQLIAEADICGCFLWNLFWTFHKFPRRTFPVTVR